MSRTPDKATIQALVRQSLKRALDDPGGSAAGEAPAPSATAAPPGTLTESQLINVAPGTILEIAPDTLVTPSAREWALFKRIEIVEQGPTSSTAPGRSVSHPPSGGMANAPARRVALAADHGGFAMKEALRPFILGLGFSVEDCGPTSTDAVDYPDLAYAAASLVSSGHCAWGVCVDGAGIGSCMTANKVPGVRAAHCYDLSTAVNARDHNDANFLTLGSGLTGQNLAQQIVKTFLRTAHGGGRHAARVDKIMAIERQFLRGGR